MLVVVPARDEAESIGACLASIAAARAALAECEPAVATRVVVVADACTDATAVIAREAGAEVVEIDARSVGVARRTGIARGLDGWRAAGGGAQTWVAMTDADSTVPRTWMLDQLDAARRSDVHVGRVVPEASHLSPAALAAWHALHDELPAAAAVHGANLGVRASALELVGGVAPMPLHEDVDLVARLRGAGAIIDERLRPPVHTSGRTRSRVEGGFASYLAALGAAPQVE
ncbi:glycosyltransferase family A protein [Agrococcus citreus]|uniref:4,4'-diaponeurosporenoate glycosyltransferase n=2 Tax=Agrococcus citreus TaxID=84643 RepID=A0ABP4JL36_9MICO